MTNWLDGVVVCYILIGWIHQTTGCGGTYRGYSGTIRSPNYPYTYSNHLSCTYVITPRKLIQLKFETFATEGGYDYVKVYNGTGNLLASLSGSHGGYTVPPSTYYRMTFTTDVSIGSSGFRAVWSSAPTISGLPTTYRVNESGRLRLDCSSYTQSSTALTYNWTYKGSTVSSGAVLNIGSIDKNQAGQYTCTATNSVGPVSAAVHVVVQYSPRISGLPSTFQVTELATLRLDCSTYTTQGNPSATSYTWSHGGSTVSTGAVLTRSSISRRQGRAYTCTVSNTVGSNTASVNVDVRYSPQISGLPSTFQVTESTSLRLDCSKHTQQGNPSATSYKWSHGGSTVSTGAVLTRSSISRRQGGEYTCTVSNTVGSASALVNIDVTYSPQISGLPSSYQVTESTSLRLDCSTYTTRGNPSATNYTWLHGGSTVSTGAVLTRSSISRRQGGAYTCTVRNTVGSDSASVNVDVTYSPRIFGLSSTYKVTESATLRLDCSTYTTRGNPSATNYTWSHGGSTVSTGAVLTRNSISRRQEGEYICTVRNTEGSDSASVSIDVRYSPQISGLPSTFQVTESTSLRLDCSKHTLQGNPSATNYTWSHGGSTVSTGAVLTRSSISRRQGGEYTCTVRNTVGSDSALVNIDVTYSPQISGLPSTVQVTESTSLRLDCSKHTQQGNPSATNYTWSHGRPTVSTGAVLTRSSISRRQGGEYTCTVRNTVGSDSALVSVDVRYSPQISGLPSTFQVTESTSLRLDCSKHTLQGKPSATKYTWSHGGSTVSTGAVLTRSSISRRQGGEYTCTVRNTVGSDSALVNIDVTYSPQISGLPSTVQVTESTSLRLDCSKHTQQGNPSATNYTWSHGRSTVSTGAVLTRSSISRRQGGEYTCTVRNTVGTDSASVNVDVRYPPRISGLPSTFQVTELATLRLDCRAYTTRGNPSATNYTWSHGGSTVSTGAVLTRNSISRRQGGEYTCIVSNTVGTDSASVNVDVRYSPQISGLQSTFQVTESASLRLDCSKHTQQGNPSATKYTWSHGGSTVSTGAVLTRSSISRRQGGEYTCTVRNTVGSDSASASVDVQYPPVLSGVPSDYRVTEHSKLFIDCTSYTSLGNPSTTNYTWSYGTSAISTTAVLQLYNINRSADGEYTCTVSNAVGNESASVTVDVQYSPVISAFPSTYRVNTSSRLWLDCSSYTTDGNPAVTNYSWVFLGSRVSSEAVLSIDTVNRTHQGRYTCTASNTLSPSGGSQQQGTASAQVDVDVQYAPSIYGLPRSYSVVEESQLLVNCSKYTSPGNPASTNYTWSYGTSVVSSEEVLQRDNVTRTEGGLYTCTVSNDVGAESASVSVDVQYEPSISGFPSNFRVIESKQLWIDCRAYTTHGNPETTRFSWTFNGSQVSATSLLEVGNISRGEGGQYTCTASNILAPSGETEHHGTATAKVKVDVQYPPTLTRSPTPRTVREMSTTFTIDCNSTTIPGNPPDTVYTWTYNGATVGDSAVLTVHNISRSQKGDYVCTASNTLAPTSGSQRQGIASTVVEVEVEYAPSISGLPSTHWVVEQSQLLIDCSQYTTPGNPTTTNYTWIYDQSVVSDEEVLQVDSMNRTDAGQYTCYVSNGVGSESSTVSVDVRYAPSITGLSSSYQMVEESDLRISCLNYTSPGNPGTSNYTWSYEGHVTQTVAVLQRSSINRTASGLYICTVYNDVGSDSAAISVDVQYPPSLMGFPWTYSVTETSRVRVDCSSSVVKGNPPSTNYTWTFNGSVITNSPVLEIHNTSREQGGRYTCTVYNTLTPTDGSPYLGTATGHVVLDVQYLPAISEFPSVFTVAESSSFSVDCSTRTSPGNPESTNYTWTHNGYIVSAGPNLVLESTGRNMSGIYTCTASNMLTPRGYGQLLGTAAASVSVDVQYGPGNSVAITSSGSPSMTEGAGAFIATCSAECNPSCSITWRKDNTPLSGQISLTNVSRTDSGDYTCHAQNGVGEAREKKILLTVYSPPTEPTDMQVAAVTDSSVSLQWTSGFNGGAHQTYSLLYKSELEPHWLTWDDNIADPGIHHQVKVHVPLLTPDMTYQFQVYGTNVYGQGEMTVINATTFIAQASFMSRHNMPVGLAAGLGVLLVGVLVTVCVVLCRRRTQRTADGEESSNLPMNPFMPRPSLSQQVKPDVTVVADEDHSTPASDGDVGERRGLDLKNQGSVDVDNKNCDVTTQD
ncbi:hemicentin-2-like isoform X6 [Haliotis rubra]|uniref:hemicentin-2-like isoform X6 n=1 Tax=Haliotis rubra TaxID=36100 RepID=UPI001EE62FFD|nr:hemicentin-2-like isoform X6 [Haliotis rubra]